MNRSQAYQFLGLCLAPPTFSSNLRERLAKLSHDDFRDLSHVASQPLQVVLPSLYPALLQRGSLELFPSDFRDYIEQMHSLNLERNEGLLLQLHDVVRTLNAAGIEPILLKGLACLKCDLYPDTGFRLIQDIDLLIPDQTDETQALLRKAGWLDQSDRGRLWYPHPYHLPPLWRDGCLGAVEIHSALGDHPAYPTPEEVRTDSTQREEDGIRFRIPSPEHLALHNMLHAQVNHAEDHEARVPLKDLVDLSLIRQRYDAKLNWHGLMSKAKAHAVQHEIEEYLLLADKFLGMDCPQPVSLGGRLRFQKRLLQSSSPVGYVLAFYAYRLIQMATNPRQSVGAIRRNLKPGWRSQRIPTLKRRLARVFNSRA